MSYNFGRLIEIYQGSNGDHTAALYKRLEQKGHIGVVAVNLFRACKASERAKNYRGKFVGAAYDKKQWSMDNLAKALAAHGEHFGIEWGWAEDPTQEKHRWVLYVELRTGQVSFHTLSRGIGPDHKEPWDQVRGQAPTRICKWIEAILAHRTVDA